MKTLNEALLESKLTDIANEIRSKTGTSTTLTFPEGFIKEISTMVSQTVQSSYVVPGMSRQVLTPASLYDGFSYIYVEGDGNLIEENIKYGTSIFGVIGDCDGNKELELIRNKTIKSISSPVSKIIDYTFYNCASLSTASFPNCEEITGKSVFANCTSLSSISLPLCEKIDGYGVFASCTSLTIINLPECTFVGYSTEVGVSDACGVFYRCTNLETVAIPNLNVCGYAAFALCSKIEALRFPLCTELKWAAFEYCIGLSNLYVPNCSVLSGRVFYGCTNLEMVNSDESGTISIPLVNSISYKTFYNCQKIKRIYAPSCLYVGVAAFYSCSGLSKIDFPLCSYISGSAFANCSNLSIVSISSSAIIGKEAFRSCINLEKLNSTETGTVVISGQSWIYGWTFANCSKIQSVSMQNCQYIKRYAFENCANLEKMNTSIAGLISLPICSGLEWGVFNGCSKIESVYIPNCSAIAAFSGCTNLNRINASISGLVSIPLCTVISSAAFCDCPNIEKVYCPSCTEIDGLAFQNCTNLKMFNTERNGYIDLTSCEWLGEQAFAECVGIESVYMPLSTQLWSSTFKGCNNLKKFNSVLSGVIDLRQFSSINNYAFCRCSSIETVYLSSCQGLANGLFWSCWRLLSLYLLRSTRMDLYWSNALSSTPIAGYTDYTSGVLGSIYVPESLYSSYITATAWSYYSSRFASFTDPPI